MLLIQNIPSVLQYFLPGYWAIVLFNFLILKKINKKTVFILCCLLSYLSITIISLFYQSENVLIISGLSFALLTIMSVLASIIYSSKWFKKILVKLFHKTPHSDIWRDVLDLDNGSNLKIYFKNNDTGIIGHHVVHEENGDNSWFAVSAPIKFSAKNDTITNDDNQNNEDYVITFRLSDVERIEIF